MVFESFANACKRFEHYRFEHVILSQPDPPEPDIVSFRVGDSEVGFELTRIHDEKAAKKLNDQAVLEPSLRNALAEAGVGGCLFLDFENEASLKQKLDAIPAIVRLVVNVTPSAADASFGESRVAIPTKLIGVLKTLSLKEGRALHVSSFSFYGDPGPKAVVKKFGKAYKCEAPLELLAYYYMHSGATFELVDRIREQFDRVIREGLHASPFRRVWLYDYGNKRILGDYSS